MSLSFRGAVSYCESGTSQVGRTLGKRDQKKEKENISCLTFIFRVLILISEHLKRTTCILKLRIWGMSNNPVHLWTEVERKKHLGNNIGYWRASRLNWLLQPMISCLWTIRTQRKANKSQGFRVSQGNHCELDSALCKTNMRHPNQNIYNNYIHACGCL